MSGNQNDTKHKISRIMTPQKAIQFLLLGLLWLLCSITVVTAGAATCSVFYVGIKILNNDPDIKVGSLFFKGIRQNFVQGLLMALVSAVTLGGFGALLTWTIMSEQSIFIILLCVGFVLVSLIFNTFAYPIIGRYENTFGNIMRNTIALVFTYLTDAFKLVIILVIEIAVDVLLFRMNLIAGFVSLLFWPTVLFYTASYFMSDIFYKVEHPIKYDENGDPVSE